MAKELTREQVQSRKDKAVRFAENVLDDPDCADEIEDESLEDYAERRGFTLTNPGADANRTPMEAFAKEPTVHGRERMATKRDLEDQIKDLQEENQDLQDRLDAVYDLVCPEDGDEEEVEEEDDDGDDDDNGGN